MRARWPIFYRSKDRLISAFLDYALSKRVGEDDER